MKKLLTISLIFCIFLSKPTEALILPLSEQDLQQQADLIVIGETVPQKKTLILAYDDTCYTWQSLRDEFKIEKTLKGESQTPTIEILYEHRKKVLDEKCVGGKTSYWLDDHVTYKLYLKAHKKDDKIYYSFLSWSGVQKTPTSSEDKK